MDDFLGELQKEQAEREEKYKDRIPGAYTYAQIHVRQLDCSHRWHLRLFVQRASLYPLFLVRPQVDISIMRGFG